jgi:hypothetical protein
MVRGERAWIRQLVEHDKARLASGLKRRILAALDARCRR